MTTQAIAAICYGSDKPFSLEPVSLGALRSDEILVRIVASGICHTDMAARDRQVPTPLPAVLGHEGAGIVEEVGSAVSSVKPGDRVLMSFHSCGDCPSCAADAPTYCYNFFPHNFSGHRADGSATIQQGDTPISGNFFGQSSFASRAIAHQRNVVKVPDSAAALPLERLAPLGCGLMTGAGAILRSMDVQAGAPVVVFGAGTVGMAAIMAAKIRGASPIIAVDLHDSRLQTALSLGATHALSGRGDVYTQINELCPQGVSTIFDTTGIKSIIEEAFGLLSPKGTLGMVGASSPEATISFNESAFMGGGRIVKGILGGDSDIQGFITELIGYHQQGLFPFEQLIGYFDFDQINEAIEASESGRVIKPVLRISTENP